MLITWSIAPERVGIAGLQTIFTTPFVVYISGAFLWSLALFRVYQMRKLYKRLLWLIVPLLILAAYWRPHIFIWLGYIWLYNINANITPQLFSSLFIVSIVATIVLTLSGGGVQMAIVIESSQLYARISRLGIMSRFYARDLILRIQTQHRLTKKTLRLSLPAHQSHFVMLFGRAVLTMLRLSPESIIQLLGQGAMLTLIVTSIIRFSGLEEIQTWVFILIIFVQSRNLDIVALFRNDMRQTFMQQFLPSSNITILLADISCSLVFVYLGSLVVVAFQFPGYLFIGGILGMIVILTLTICQIFEALPENPFMNQYIPYEYYVTICWVPIAIAGYITQSLYSTVLVILLELMCLTILLYSTLNKRNSADSDEMRINSDESFG